MVGTSNHCNPHSHVMARIPNMAIALSVQNSPGEALIAVISLSGRNIGVQLSRLPP